MHVLEESDSGSSRTTNFVTVKCRASSKISKADVLTVLKLCDLRRNNATGGRIEKGERCTRKLALVDESCRVKIRRGWSRWAHGIIWIRHRLLLY